MNLNLPLFSITPDMDDENQGMFLVSLVDEPAINVDFLAFNSEESLKFAVQDEEKHIITGPAIIADVPIYRRNKNGEFYVVFKKDDIPAIVEKFMQRGLSNFINIQHEEDTLSSTDAVMIESYFINKERGIYPQEFKNITEGSWFCSFKVLNDDIWKLIKSGDLKGFSIEIATDLEPVKMEKEKTDADYDQEIIDKLDLAGQAKKNNVGKVEKSPILEDGPDLISSPKRTIDLDTKSYQSIAYAIQNQKMVLLNYTGNTAGGFRQVAISAFGTTLAGNEALRIYEFSGASESGGVPGWRILLYDDIVEFHVTDVDAETTTQPGYGNGESCNGDPGTFSSVMFEIGDILS